MACVKFLLLALAYMCSNEVKQRCVQWLQFAYEYNNTRQCDEYR